MIRHALVVLDPDGHAGVVDLAGEPEGHSDLERVAGAPLWPAGPDVAVDVAGEHVVLHRVRGPRLGGPVPAALTGPVSDLQDEESGRRPPPAARAPWYLPGWDVDALAWTDAALAGLGRYRSGPAAVVRVWSLSVLLRVPTAEGVVWLKGCAPCFPAEVAATRWLSRRHPGAVPDVLAADPDRGLLLMAPFAAGDATPALLSTVGERIALLQLSSVPHRAELLAAGVPERGLGATAARFAEVVDRALGDALVTGAVAARLPAAVPAVERWCAELTGAGLPDTLCHGDLHLGNVAPGGAGPGGGEPVVFDWSDACWSHPFVDVVHLPQVGSGSEAAAGWERTYLDRWCAAGWSDDVVTAAFAVAGPVERAFQAVTYADLGAALEPGAARALDGVLPRILGQIADLASR